MIRWALVLVAVLGCSRERPRMKGEAAEPLALEEAESTADRAQAKEGKGGSANRGIAGLSAPAAAPSRAVAYKAAMPTPAAPPPAEPADEPAAPTRAWFPETFLFNPLVVTDDSGGARISVRVPDRLTTWRVLALAHSRAGGQAGAETSFLGTLPTYVDPVVPAFLMTGDEVALPIQVVNTTDAAVTAPLRVEVTGATLAKPLPPVHLAAQGRQVVYAQVRATRPGGATLRAALGEHDAVVRAFPVRPTGRPVVEVRRGTLAAPRALDVALPADLDKVGATARLLVFPGALAILRAELAAAAGRAARGGDAYALLLAGRGEALLRALGGDPQPAELRALAIVAGQRVLRAARSPDPVTAALLAEAALAHPGNAVLSRLGERLADTIAAGQRPDGTFAGGDGWTLQRLLVTTADCVRAVRAATGTPRAAQRATRVTLRARTAFERNAERIADPYTAASILASGAVGGELRDRLRTQVRKGLQASPDGARVLPVGVKGAPPFVRADGLAPSEVEATALAVLALEDDQAASALVPDLGARLLAGYNPQDGFGDGRTNLVALQAVLALFRQPLPPKVTVTFSLDGHPLAERVLEGPKLRETLALDVALPAAAGKHRYELRALPAVPGLGYALALTGYLPWPARPEAAAGLELSLPSPSGARVGRAVDIVIQAGAPAGIPLTVRQALPAGVQLDTASLDALVAAHTITGYEREDGAVTLRIPPLAAGQAFTARYRAIPTLAGTLTTAASSIAAGDERQQVPPTRWVVR